jgi:hypothetical protein
MSVSDDVVAKFTQLATPIIANARDDEAAAAELRKGLTFSAAMAKFRRI